MQRNETTYKEILNIVSSIEPYDKIERKHIYNTLDWIRNGDEIFRVRKPATPPKHLVTYTVLFDPKVSKILLLEHAKAGLLLPSGGHVDKNENPKDTAVREAKEELNLKTKFVFNNPIFITQTMTVGNFKQHLDVTFWYVLEGDSRIDPDESSTDFKREFNQYSWYSFEGILALPLESLDPNMHRFVYKMKQYISKL